MDADVRAGPTRDGGILCGDVVVSRTGVPRAGIPLAGSLPQMPLGLPAERVRQVVHAHLQPARLPHQVQAARDATLPHAMRAAALPRGVLGS